MTIYRRFAIWKKFCSPSIPSWQWHLQPLKPLPYKVIISLSASLSALDSNRCLISLCGLWHPGGKGGMRCQDSWGWRRRQKRATCRAAQKKGGGGQGGTQTSLHPHPAAPRVVSSGDKYRKGSRKQGPSSHISSLKRGWCQSDHPWRC